MAGSSRRNDFAWLYFDHYPRFYFKAISFWQVLTLPFFFFWFNERVFLFVCFFSAARKCKITWYRLMSSSKIKYTWWPPGWETLISVSFPSQSFLFFQYSSAIRNLQSSVVPLASHNHMVFFLSFFRTPNYPHTHFLLLAPLQYVATLML